MQGVLGVGNMRRFREWINRDDGRWFRVGNGNLNRLETIGALLMILGVVLVSLNRKQMFEVPAWALILIFLASAIAMYRGMAIKGKP
jgi:hypothetical protein